jgi:hypothetical protein
MPFSNLRNQE